MAIRSSLSIQDKPVVQLRVVSSAPNSINHIICRNFYKVCDLIAQQDNMGPDDYKPYNGWMPVETNASMLEKRLQWGAFHGWSLD